MRFIRIIRILEATIPILKDGWKWVEANPDVKQRLVHAASRMWAKILAWGRREGGYSDAFAT